MKKQKRKVPQKMVKNTILLLFSSLIVLFGFWTTELSTKPDLPQSREAPALYSNQARDDLKTLYISAISHAKKSVLLSVYTLTDEGVIGALRSKAEEGVPVEVVVDGKETPFIERKLGKSVRVLKRFGPGLMHLKLLVVDGEQVLIGSANMTNESLRMHGNLAVAFFGPDLAQMISEKITQLPEEGRSPPLKVRSYAFAQNPTEVWFLPDNNTDASRKIKKLMQTAQKSIRVAMFAWTRIDFAKALVSSAQRGVKVEVALDQNLAKSAGAKVVEYLKENGIPVWMSRGSALLHYKFMYIDGTTLVSGSANWTKAAFKKNDDCFIVLEGLQEAQRQKIDTVWNTIIQEAEK